MNSIKTGALLSDRKEERRRLWKLALLCFGVSSGMMALIYFCIGVPFFGNSVLVLDLNGQYVYFFESLHDIIYNGNSSLLWSWMRSLGGEYLGIYAYYLASPFSWLVALLPSQIITEALYLMIVAKVGLAGGTMGFFLHKTYPTCRRNVVLFSAMYAFCAWSLMYGNNVMWLDALFLFPIVIYGANQLLSGKNYIIYTVSLALTILSNFYIGYMVCIFLAIYFFYFHIAKSRQEDYNPKGQKVFFLRSGLRYLFFTLLACGIGAVIIAGAAYSLSFGKNTFTDPTYEFTFKLTFLDIIYKLLPGAVDTVRREGLPFLYCGTSALFGAAVFFVSGRFKIREKLGAGLLFLLLAFCFSVSVIDIWWHGGQEPNWLNYRYSFIFSFFLLVCAYRGFEKIEKVSNKALALVPAGIFIFYVILQVKGYGHGYEYTEGEFPYNWSYDLLYYFLGVLIVGLVFAGILYFKKNAAKRAGSVMLCCVILGEILCMGVLHHVGLAVDVGYCLRSSYTDYMARVTPAVDYINGMDDHFFRMDKTFHRQPADAMALEMRSLSSTTSTLNKKTLAFLKKMGYAAGSYWSEYLGGNPATDLLFDVKYILTEDTEPDAYYRRIYTNERPNKIIHDPFEDKDLVEKQSVYGYLNPYALSLAFCADNKALYYDADMYPGAIERINGMYAALTGKGISPFAPVGVTESIEGLKSGHSSSVEHRILTPEKSEGSLTLTFEAAESGPYYLQVPTDYPRECALFVDDIETGTVMGNETDRIIPLGVFEAGSAHSVRIAATDNKIYIKDGAQLIWFLDMKEVEKAYGILSPGAYEIDRGFREDRLKGTVVVPEDKQVLFTSIPYDKGWIFTVDGQEVKPMLVGRATVDPKTGKNTSEQQPFADALTVLVLEPGRHTLECVYRPSCVLYGGLVSAGALVLFLVIIAVDFLLVRRIKKKKAAKRAAAENKTETKTGKAPDPAGAADENQKEPDPADVTDESREAPEDPGGKGEDA